MLLHIEKDVYRKAFGKIIFSNSKLDVYTREGKLCSVNRDLLMFFSPFVKQLLRDVHNSIRASLVLPDVSVDCLQHVFKVISNGFTEFASIQDLKDAGDILGINLDCLEYVENNPETNIVRAEAKVLREAPTIAALDINNIKKEVIDDVEIKKELSEEVITNVVSEEIHLQVKKSDVGVENVGTLNDHHKDPNNKEPADKAKPSNPLRTVPNLKYKTPSRIRRNLRRALLHKAMNDDKDGGSRLENLLSDATNKAEILKALEKPLINSSQNVHTKYPTNQSQSTLNKPKFFGTWHAVGKEYVNDRYSSFKPRDSYKPRDDEERRGDRKSRDGRKNRDDRENRNYMENRDEREKLVYKERRDDLGRSRSRSTEWKKKTTEVSGSSLKNRSESDTRPSYTLEEGEIE